ncbi:MAG: septum formation protein Maf [Caldilineaceae bacterium]|nr:septum formation protein Maf [Caldilineaceae bacterium]
MQQPTIILASGSPRRQQFLRELSLDFQVIVADIDETPHDDEAPEALARRLAESKAAAVATRLPPSTAALIIAADTVVAQAGTLLGKPADSAEATAVLQQLRNRPHQVHSSVCLLETGSKRTLTRVNSTEVQMRDYSDADVAAYVASGDPFDKAGAYAIQHPAFAPVCAVQGCISGVIGLPLADLREMLAAFGITVRATIPTICRQHTIFGCCQDAVQNP